MLQRLAPGVQHQQDADLGAEPFRVGGHVAQRRCRRLQQGIVDDARIGPGQVGHGLRQREDDVVILDRQQVLGLALQPLGTRQGLALRTVTVAAGVVSDTLVPAVQAADHVPAQRRRAASRQVAQRPSLRAGQPDAVPRRERITTLPNHLRHFQRRPLRRRLRLALRALVVCILVASDLVVVRRYYQQVKQARRLL